MRYRVYFNSSADPQKWSIDEGEPSTEITVMGVNICVPCESHCNGDGTQPKGWLEVRGDMTIRSGWASFR